MAEDSLQTLCRGVTYAVHFTADFSQSGTVISGGGSQIWDLDDARIMNFATLPALAYDGSFGGCADK